MIDRSTALEILSRQPVQAVLRALRRPLSMLPVGWAARLPHVGPIEYRAGCYDVSMTAGGRDVISNIIARKGASAFEPETTAFLLDHFQHDDRPFVDIGANVGFFSMLCAATNPTRPILCFEPQPMAFDALAANAELNGLDRFELRREAVGAEAGSLALNQRHGIAIENDATLIGEAGELGHQVQVVPLDDYLDWFDRLGGIGVMKIDVEGFEAEVLAGARGCIATHRPPIVIELVDDRTVEAASAFCEEHAYEPRAITRSGGTVRLPHGLSRLSVKGTRNGVLLPLNHAT